MANQQPILIKLTYVHGLRDVVSDEMAKIPELGGLLRTVERNADFAYFDFIPATISEEEIENTTRDRDQNDDGEKNKDEIEKEWIKKNAEEAEKSADMVESFLDTLDMMKKLKSVTNIYLAQKSEKFHPIHINKHKSILGTMIELTMHSYARHTEHLLHQPKIFKTFKLRCAGSDSPDAMSIQRYIADTFKVVHAEEADLDTYIHKPGELWEVGVRITPRPLSVRNYKVEHIKGGMNPTVAYALNSFALAGMDGALAKDHASDGAAGTSSKFSYLNICSGSATLPIEAAIEIGSKINECKILGFDIDKKTNSLAIQNIKKAGFITSVQIKTADLLDKPDFGMFDAIASDLPFGMQISKEADLNKLYKAFVEYAENHLNTNGTLAVYTTETDTFERALRGSKFQTQKTVSLQITTAANSTIKPKIFVCAFKPAATQA